MAVGDTWIAKQTGEEGSTVITVHSYRPDGSLADSFTIDEPSDARKMDPENEWQICIVAANGIIVVLSGNYVYTRDMLGAFYSYKYHDATDDAAPWFAGFNNGQFYICAVYPFISGSSQDYTASIFYTSNNGVVWALRHTGLLASATYPGVLWNVNYDATSGHYYVSSEIELYPIYPGVTYSNERFVSRTSNFVTYANIGNEDEQFISYDLNIDAGQIRWLNYRDNDESYFQRAYICELNTNGIINTLPITNIPEERWAARYGSLLVDLTGRPYVLMAESSAYDTFYICKRNNAGTAYVKGGSAITYENMSFFWYMSNYRVYNPSYGYVTLEYHNTGPGSVRVVSSNTSGFVIPLDNSENWHCCYLETGADFDAPFWCEYDDCSEEKSDY